MHIYTIGAIHAFACCLPGIVAPKFAGDLYFAYFPGTVLELFMLRFICVLVFGYSCGYYWAGEDPRGGTAMIKSAVVAKTGVFLLLSYAYMNGLASFIGFITGISDLVLAYYYYVEVSK